MIISDLFLIGIMVVLTLYVVKTMARLAASTQVECSRQETARGRVKVLMALVGMACILGQRFANISPWDIIMIGVMLVAIVRKLQAGDDVMGDVRLHSSRYRLAAGIGALVFLIVFFNVSFAMKLVLSSLVAMACLGKWKPTHVSEQTAETPVEPPIAQGPGDEIPPETQCPRHEAYTDIHEYAFQEMFEQKLKFEI